MPGVILRGGTALICLLVLAACSADREAAGGSATASQSQVSSLPVTPLDLPDTQKVTGAQSGWTIQVPVGWLVQTPETIADQSESELDALAGRLGYDLAIFRQIVADPALDVVAFNPDAFEEIRLTWYPSRLPLGRKDYAGIVAQLGGTQHTTRPEETSTGFNTLTAFSGDSGELAGRMMVGRAREGTGFLILMTEAESTAAALEPLLVRGVTASP